MTKRQRRNMEKWIEALESGLFKQGKRFLRKGDRYCCLGVACEALGLKAKLPAYGDRVYEYEGTNALLPYVISKRLGISKEGFFDEELIPKKIWCNKSAACSLAGLNDEGVKFRTIARILRYRLEAKVDPFER